MFLFVACLSLITQATDLDYDDLVSNVEDTLNGCSTIMDGVGNYVEQVYALDGLRRRGTNVKLGACKSILEAVDTYRAKHKRQVMIQGFAERPGNAILNVLLERRNKRIGEVLYIASRDGDDMSEFHRKCDGKGDTILVVQSTTGAVFGGYTDVSWTRSTGWKSSKRSFLFTIYPTVKYYDIISGQKGRAVYHDPNRLMFGPSGQLEIKDKSLHNFNSMVNTPGARAYNTPSNNPYVLNNGVKHFKVLNFFVVKVIN